MTTASSSATPPPDPQPSASPDAGEGSRARRKAALRNGTIVGLIVLAVVLGAIWWRARHDNHAATLTLYGNIDLRQVELPFNNSERIAAVLVEEGDRVRRGQVLARLDTRRLQPQVAQAQAEAAAQQAVVDRLLHGNRPEEIAQARANVALAAADAENARVQYRRLADMHQYASRQDVDNARAAMDVAQAQLAVNRKALELELAGPRKEDIAQAEAQLRADQAQLARLTQQLADAALVSPVDGVVRTRLLEAGEMASPQQPVFTLSITSPKWVRAYVSETDLGKVRLGMPASVSIDSFPDRRFDGWVGFVSPVAEFTPKTVQTDELRTSLVYEVRVFVRDPGDALPLGAPATVQLSLAAAGAARAPSPAAPRGTTGR